MEYPKISVITPALNFGCYMEQCIRGVLWQDYPNFEHIIVDGGSQDETLTVLRKYPHLRWVSEPDEGLSDAFNKGVVMATGDVIGWCSADDYYIPGVFKIVARFFRNDPALTVLYGDHRYIDSDGAPKYIKREIGFDLFILKYLHMNYIRTSTAFWRRNLHEDGFWFNKTLHYAMDYDFMLRVAVAGYRIEHVSTLFADFRNHPMSKSADRQQSVEHEQIARLYVPQSENSPPFVVSAIHKVLRGIARTKRSCKRLCMGHYYDQFWRS